MAESREERITGKGNDVAEEPLREVFTGELRGVDIIVCDREGVTQLYRRGYGFTEGECLKLSLLEAAYLLYRGLLTVKDSSGKELNFEELLRLGGEYDPEFWTRLNVYTDLRNRALVVMPGVHNLEFLLDWKRKTKTKRYLIRVVKEGTRLSFREFEEMFRRALESDRELVMAIVDKEGVISYYIVEGVLREGLPEFEDSDEVQVEQEG
ncbi:MAG: hypothetical protein ACP5II_05250 [Infirmifilum sp.]|uniref:tRNA intron endonuclease catalytic domain-containing protein n=1 Tax=Infirmifilum uzonense TaxID=1550241 RepID=A0A0F7FIJ8_9CREN|nr:hypothetical protein [Infirmifilum uzonense]AKG39245.1 hypothetical protein MA03_08435 [Infirmifilum uzonense]